jgi:hypothetical protein
MRKISTHSIIAALEELEALKDVITPRFIGMIDNCREASKALKEGCESIRSFGFHPSL